MDTELLQQGSIGLNQGELLRLRDAGGHFLGVVAGTVWITQESDTQDRILGAGEHFRFDRGGLALVWPLDGSAKLMLEDGLVAERHLAPQVISVTRHAWLPDRAFFERRARQMRAEAIGQATGQVLAAIAQGVKSLWGQIARVYAAASQALLTARSLPALADSTLKDIGVHRDQIKRIANSPPRQVGINVMNKPSLAKFTTAFQPVIGVAISIRPLNPDDFDIEDAFLRGLSTETRNKRLLGGARAITPEYVTRLTRVDYPREFALAAVVVLDGRETLLGVARYAMDSTGDSCEFALVVADTWQGRGLGKFLLQRLIDVARAHGIARMMGFTLSTNSAMLGLARQQGFERRFEVGDARLTRLERKLDTFAMAA